MSGFVYFAVCQTGENETCKIGYTAKDPRKRVGAIQRMCPVNIDLLAYVEGDMRLEQKLHQTFAPLRLHGEWFQFSHKLFSFVTWLTPNSPCDAPTSKEQFTVAVSDCILGDLPPYICDESKYRESAISDQWIGAQ